MRTIPPLAILAFAALMTAAAAMTVAGIWIAWPLISLTGSFSGTIATAMAVLIFFAAAIGLYRLLFACTGIPTGDIGRGTRDEFLIYLHFLHTIALYQPVMSSLLLPVPIMRLFYRAIGARMGANTYSAGLIFDAITVQLGANTMIGQKAMLIPHVIEGERVALRPIRVGSGVTIGANAIVLAGAEIGDGATVAAGAVVTAGTCIPPGQLWGGVPARCLRPNRTDVFHPLLVHTA